MRLTPFLLTQNLSVDNALSTIQVIHQLIHQINKVIEQLNNIDSNANTYTDSKISELSELLKSDIDQLEKDLKSYTDTTVKNATDVIDDTIRTVYEHIDTVKTEVIDYVNLEDSKIKVSIEDMYSTLIDLIRKGNGIIYSGVDGRLKPIEDVFADVVNVIQQKNGINWDKVVSIAKAGGGGTSNAVTWNSWTTKLKALARFNNWNSLAFYTVWCLNESFVDVGGVSKNVQPTPMMLSLWNEDFY